MKWVNHQVLTGVIVYAATDDMLLTIYSMAGQSSPTRSRAIRMRAITGAGAAVTAAGRTGRSCTSV